MKRNLKKLFMAVAVSAVSVFAVLGASCDSSASEWIEHKIEQIKCEHVTTKVIERVLPTCTEKGYTEGLECVDCGKVVTKPDEVKALGHTIVTYEEVEATCLTKGKTEGEYCTVCETWLKEIKDIKATGHSVEVIEGKDPTCTETGLTNGQACDKCGEVYVAQKVIPALGHDVNDSGYCKVCGMFDLSYYAKGIANGTCTTRKMEVNELVNNKVLCIELLSAGENKYSGNVDFLQYDTFDTVGKKVDTGEYPVMFTVNYNANEDTVEMIFDNPFVAGEYNETFSYYGYFNEDKDVFQLFVKCVEGDVIVVNDRYTVLFNKNTSLSCGDNTKIYVVNE